MLHNSHQSVGRRPQNCHFLYSMPSGGFTSTFLSPISFQLVDSTVPPDSVCVVVVLVWFGGCRINGSLQLPTETHKGLHHGLSGFVGAVGVDLLEELIEGCITLLLVILYVACQLVPVLAVRLRRRVLLARPIRCRTSLCDGYRF